MYNLQVCACFSMSEGGWIINVCSSQHLSVHVSGKGNNRTFYILQVTSYFSDPGARNLILSKLGNLCFSLNGILAVINPLPRCVLPEEGMCNQQDWCAGFWMNYVQLPWCGRPCWAHSLHKTGARSHPQCRGDTWGRQRVPLSFGWGTEARAGKVDGQGCSAATGLRALQWHYVETSHCVIHFWYVVFRKWRSPEVRSEYYWVFFPSLGKNHSEILPVLQARSSQDKKSQSMWQGAMGPWLIAGPTL